MKRLIFIFLLVLLPYESWAGRSAIQTDNFDDNNLGIGSVIWNQINSSNAVMGNTSGTVGSNHVSEAVIRADGTYAADQYSKLTITTLPGSVNDAIGVTCRGSADTGSSRDYYKMIVNGAGPKLTTLARVQNGTSVNIQTSTAITWATNDTIEIECDAAGAIRGYKNGVSVLSGTNTDLTTGKPGISSTNTPPRGDTWEGGDITAGGVSAAPPIRVIIQ